MSKQNDKNAEYSSNLWDELSLSQQQQVLLLGSLGYFLQDIIVRDFDTIVTLSSTSKLAHVSASGIISYAPVARGSASPLSSLRSMYA